MCVLIRNTFCESLVKICATKHKCRSFLRTMLHACPIKQSQKPKIMSFKIIFDKIWYFWTYITIILRRSCKKSLLDKYFLNFKIPSVFSQPRPNYFLVHHPPHQHVFITSSFCCCFFKVLYTVNFE